MFDETRCPSLSWIRNTNKGSYKPAHTESKQNKLHALMGKEGKLIKAIMLSKVMYVLNFY